MAVAYVAHDTKTGTTPSMSINGTGSDRLVVLLGCGNSGGIRTLTDQTLNSVSSSGLSSGGADGGTAIMMGRGYQIDSVEPGAGSFTFTDTWTGGAAPGGKIVVAVELSGVDQGTPVDTSATATNTGTLVANGGTVSLTVTGASGKFAIGFICSTNAGASGNHGLPSGFTEISDSINGSTRLCVGYIGSIASSSETYNFTASGDGSSTMDSVFVGVLVINASGGTTANGYYYMRNQ